jgi:peptidoglycan/xylan/chitin deacetylase (PgdA/CDA1 family)
LEQWIKSLAHNENAIIDILCQLWGIDEKHYLKMQRPYMSSDEIKQLAYDGFTIGAHSVSHQRLASLNEIEIENDITVACKEIMSLTKKTQVPFAFPFSAEGVSRDVLFRIRQKHQSVGLFFATNGISSDRDFVYSRMCGDWPNISDPNSTNLPNILARAYHENLSTKVRRMFKSIR